MAAPLVERLLQAISTEPDPAKQAESLALLACYEARIGSFEAAEHKRLQIRRDFGSGQYPRVSILLMCLEALQLFFRELSPKARDRMMRANLVSELMRETQLVAVTSAWLAHIDFNLGDFATMIADLRKCFAAIELDDGSAECRASLVLGDAFLFADCEAEARTWHERSRVLASKLGDQAAFGAITYNRAAMRVSVGRLDALTTQLSASRLSLLDAEVRSAISYQGAARLSSLEHLLGSARAGIHMLREQFDLAEREVDATLSSGEVPKGSGEEFLLHADRALCLAKRGEHSRAAMDAAFVQSVSLALLSPDDRAVVQDSLSRYFFVVGSGEKAAQHATLAKESLEAHRATIEVLKQLLEPFARGPAPTSKGVAVDKPVA